MTSRTPKTSIKPRPAGSLKAATDQLVNAVGGQTRAAELTNKSRTVMARYTDDAELDRWMPVDVVRVLERAAGQPHVTAYLAFEAGCILKDIAADTAAHACDLAGDLAAGLAMAARQCSDVSVTGIEALADGRISVNEARTIIKQADEAMQALMAVRDGARAVVDQTSKVCKISGKKL